jgi:hypothetical protein
MSAHGSFYPVLVANQPKKIIVINTKQTKYLRSVPQESITGIKINDKFKYTVPHLLITDLAARELSCCAKSRSIPLQGC